MGFGGSGLILFVVFDGGILHDWGNTASFSIDELDEVVVSVGKQVVSVDKDSSLTDLSDGPVNDSLHLVESWSDDDNHLIVFLGDHVNGLVVFLSVHLQGLSVSLFEFSFDFCVDLVEILDEESLDFLGQYFQFGDGLSNGHLLQALQFLFQFEGQEHVHCGVLQVLGHLNSILGGLFKDIHQLFVFNFGHFVHFLVFGDSNGVVFFIQLSSFGLVFQVVRHDDCFVLIEQGEGFSVVLVVQFHGYFGVFLVQSNQFLAEFGDLFGLFLNKVND